MSLVPISRFHFVVHAGSIFLAFISQVISDVFYSLARETNVPNAVFHTSSRNVSETFALEVTMDKWSDNNWIIIDFWSKAWLVYAMFDLFKRYGNALSPELCNPELHTPQFYWIWIVINYSRTSSMVLWDRQLIIAAVLVRWMLPVCSFCMLSLSYSTLYKHRTWLAINNPNVISWTRYLTQNGLAVFAWWSLFYAVVDIGIALKYIGGVPDPLASTIVLSIISVCIITWFSLQSFLLAKYMRHTFTVHATLVLGLGAMFTSSYCVNDFSVNTAICGILMVLVTIVSFIHLISACLYMERPIKPAAEPYVLTVCQPEGNMKNKLES